VESLPPQVQAAARGPARRMVADKLVEVKLLAGEAQKEGLEKDPKIQAQLELQRQQVLAQAMAEKAQKTTDEAALKKQYEDKKGDFETVKARHILIHTKGAPGQLAAGKTELTDEQAKAKAEELRKRIVDKKEDFGAIAKAESDDPGSAQAGGELPPFTKGQMVPDFEKSAFSLKPGEVSEPVKTPFGYHLIQVQERKTPSFDDVKEELQAQQGPQKVEEFVKKLKAQTPVKIDESFFGPAVTRPSRPANMPPKPE
jgi:parvulin-like peptidyl-prolyl isomerase